MSTCKRCAHLEEQLTAANATIASLAASNADLARAAVDASAKALTRVPAPQPPGGTVPHDASIGRPGLFSPLRRDAQKDRSQRLAGERPQQDKRPRLTQAEVEAQFRAPDTPAAQ